MAGFYRIRSRVEMAAVWTCLADPARTDHRFDLSELLSCREPASPSFDVAQHGSQP
jgi:hypothetical protein